MSIWAEAGVFVSRLDAPALQDGTRYGRMLHNLGYRWVSIQIHNGLGIEEVTENALDAGWAQQVKGQGIHVGGWGVLQDHPEREANYADQLLYKWHLESYVADAEGPHKGDWPHGDAHRSDTFVRHFRKLRPRLPAALSTFGAASSPWVLGSTTDDDAGPMHFRCWHQAGFHFLPQAYLPEGSVYEPSTCIDHARRAGWELHRVHLTVGIYNGYQAASYVDKLKSAITVSSGGLSRGFSVFPGENATDTDLEMLAAAVA